MPFLPSSVVAGFVCLSLLIFVPQPAEPVRACLTCSATPDSTQLDRFRVTTRLSRPFCPMEIIQCDRDQDVCVTVTMHIGGGEYWLGAGCDKRASLIAGGGAGGAGACQNVRTLARSVQLGYAHERYATQRVCVCARDLCNGGSRSFSSSLPLLVGLVSSLQLLLLLPRLAS